MEMQTGDMCHLELILPQRIIPDCGVQWLQGRGGAQLSDIPPPSWSLKVAGFERCSNATQLAPPACMPASLPD